MAAKSGRKNGGQREVAKPAVAVSACDDVSQVAENPAETPFASITHPKKRAYLTALAATGQIAASAAAAGVHRATTTWWTYTERDPDFLDALARAKQMAAESLEAEAFRRAFNGADVLLIFLLKGAYPERYKDRVDQTLSSPEGKALRVDPGRDALPTATVTRLLALATDLERIEREAPQQQLAVVPESSCVAVPDETSTGEAP